MLEKKQKLSIVRPVFVETIPIDSTDIKEEILYISMKYNTLVHRCPCGCGGLSEIGLHPATRSLIYDGQNVTIEPSIGVQALPCKSHYWIRKNRILWAKPLGKDADEIFDRKRRVLTTAFERKANSRRLTK